MSFRRRLTLFLSLTLIGVQALTALLGYFYMRHDLVLRGEAQLKQDIDTFKRQLELMSENVADGVHILSLDYALRSAIAQRDLGTELSALKNHGRRIGATRMLLIDMQGAISADTMRPDAGPRSFPFPDLVGAAIRTDKGTALAVLDGQVYWIVVAPIRAPLPIGFIAACVPVDQAMLDKLRAVSGGKLGITLLAAGDGRGWRALARSAHPYADAAVPPMPAAGASKSLITTHGGDDYLTLVSPLPVAAGSAPLDVMLTYSLEEALAVYKAIITPALLVLVLALIGTMLGASIIVRSVARPLEKLAAVARRIAGGDYTRPEPIRQAGEVGHLSDAIANMTDSIAQRESALTSANRTLDIARAEAMRANAAKTQFLMNMSHEFRTPLNAIVGFSEMMAHQMLGPLGVQKYADYAGDIHQSGQKLLGMVDRMFDLADAEQGHLVIGRDPLSAAALMQDCVRTLLPFATQRGVWLSMPDAPDWPAIEGDAKKLTEAFHHLLHNAIKFSPHGRAVDIAGRGDGDMLVVTITDHGIGIAADRLEEVVRPFHRQKGALDGDYQGAGLGLPFAKAVIEGHGGAFSLTSEPDAGTQVRIGLPVAAQPVRDAA